MVLILLGRFRSIVDNNVPMAIRIVTESRLSDSSNEAAKLSKFKELGEALRTVCCGAACGLWMSFKRSLAQARQSTDYDAPVDGLYLASTASSSSTATTTKSPSALLNDKEKTVVSSTDCWVDNVFC